MAGIITSAKLGGVPQTASRHVAMATCFDVYMNKGSGIVQIGFISSLTIGHTRTVTQIRHLNSINAGVAVDTVLTPDVVSLQFQGFYVYTAGSSTTGAMVNTSALAGPTMGRSSGQALLMTLDQQNIPFDIVVKHAGNSTATVKAGTGSPDNQTVIGVYKNCTIQGMSIPLNIGTAGVTDSGTISVGYVSDTI